jgi:hypothetical protein
MLKRCRRLLATSSLPELRSRNARSKNAHIVEVQDRLVLVVVDDDQPVLTLARDVPIEQAQVSWAFERQQPAVIDGLDQEARFSSSKRLLSERGLQSACAVP